MYFCRNLQLSSCMDHTTILYIQSCHWTTHIPTSWSTYDQIDKRSYRHIRLEISGVPSERIWDSRVHRNRKHHFVRFRQAQTIFWRNYKTRSNCKHEAQTTNSDHTFHLLKKPLEPGKTTLENTNEGSQYKCGERRSQARLKFSPASQQSRTVLIKEKVSFPVRSWEQRNTAVHAP